MSVGKRIYLKREMPDPEVMAQFKTIPASNTADVMNRSCAMNPRIRLVSQPKDQMMVGRGQPDSPRRPELLPGGGCACGLQRGGHHPGPHG